MNSLTDQQLLRDYTGRRSEAAFAELVRRHVDFVYSAALRMVHDAPLAEDVTQGVFVALAQNAPQLTDHPVLTGWLHCTAQNLAAKAVRSDVRRRAREQEAATMNELRSAEPEAAWESDYSKHKHFDLVKDKYGNIHQHAGDFDDYVEVHINYPGREDAAAAREKLSETDREENPPADLLPTRWRFTRVGNEWRQVIFGASPDNLSKPRSTKANESR